MGVVNALSFSSSPVGASRVIVFFFFIETRYALAGLLVDESVCYYLRVVDLFMGDIVSAFPSLLVDMV